MPSLNSTSSSGGSPLDPYLEELIFYRFRRALYKAEHAIKRLNKFINQGSNFYFTSSFHTDKPVHVTYELPDEKTLNEFLYSIAPLVDSNSPIYWEAVLNSLFGDKQEDDIQKALALVRKTILEAEIGSISLMVNDKNISAKKDLLQILSEVMYADDTLADEFIRRFYNDPFISSLRLFRLHSYATSFFSALNWMALRLEVLKALPRGPRPNHCVYCKTTDGVFTSVEHIMPESLGNDDILLPRGWVCNKCNATFGELEQRILGTLPFNQLRFFAPVLTKQGKFPELKTNKFHLIKKRHNQIIWKNYAGKKGQPLTEPLEDGEFKFSFSVSDATFDALEVARFIIKIGLGILAINHGIQSVHHAELNDARRFALEGGSFASRLWMTGSIQPKASISARLLRFSPKGWVVITNLLGVRFMVGLTREPKPQLPHKLPNVCFGWDLWSEEKGPHHTVGKA